MKECVCNSCKNLKSIITEESGEERYECIHGYPSEKCEECMGEGCEETCGNYLFDDGEDVFAIVKCAKCGKELKKAYKDEPEGDVLCVDCYLNG
ncbi:MAG: hypothetical protein N3I35_18455 [Clostridia bacterium]|nr:hypothetical protein [Clostridia bacterium]